MSDIDTITSRPQQDHAAPVPGVGEHSLERIASAFETGMRRWEVIIYPALFAFVILAAYGFFLVYSLTRDVERLAADVGRMADAVAPSMVSMSDNMGAMNRDIHQMNINMAGMATAIHHMNASLWDMNRNISPPMDAFNSMMPWGNSAPIVNAPPPMMPMYPQPMPPAMMYGQPQPMIYAPAPMPAMTTNPPAVVAAPPTPADVPQSALQPQAEPTLAPEPAR
ncbi:MAG TPA: hypothetical protein ENO09_06375 [bacterium]|nr:hypothetical protein [bacterium]